VLGKIFNRQILCGVNAVLRQNIVECIFRQRTLPGGIDCFTFQIGQRRDLGSLGDHIKHSQCIEREQLNVALGFVVKCRGKVGGQRGDIQFAAQQLGRHIIRRAGDGKGVIIRSCFVFGLIHQLDHSEAGRSLQHSNPDGGFCRRRRRCLLRRRCCRGPCCLLRRALRRFATCSSNCQQGCRHQQSQKTFCFFH